MEAKESTEDILKQLFRNFFIFHNEANLNTISIDAYFNEWYKARSIMIKSVLETSQTMPSAIPYSKLKEKLISMRYTKEKMDKMTYDDALEAYGWTDCINILLIWLNNQPKDNQTNK